MNIRNIKSLFKKELLDVLRDKKTVIMMVIVPIILYPLLIVLSLQVMSRVTTQMTERTYIAAVDSYDDEVSARFVAKNRFSDYSLKIVEVSDPDEALVNEDIDVYIKISNEEGKDIYEIYYLS